MRFYLIRDIEDEFCNGVLIESEDHRYGARLAGDGSVDDPDRVIQMMISRNGGRLRIVVPELSGGRRLEELKTGDPGYLRALLLQLKTPLVIFREGLVTEPDIPEQVTLMLWKRFADPKVGVPIYRSL